MTRTLSTTPSALALWASIAAAVVLPALLGRAQSPFNSSLPPNASPYGGGREPMSASRPPSGGSVAPPRAGTLASDVPAPAVGDALTLENIGPDYHLRRGDQLSYQVKEDRDPASVLEVTASGEVLPPYLGGRGIDAVGKTVGELQGEIKGALERELYVHASVQIGLLRVAPRSSKGRVYMTGAVRTIGPIEIPTDEVFTVSKAILKAGGATDFANLKDVRILRKGGPAKGIAVNVKAVLYGKSEVDPELQPGDTVRVPESLVHFGF